MKTALRSRSVSEFHEDPRNSCINRCFPWEDSCRGGVMREGMKGNIIAPIKFSIISCCFHFFLLPCEGAVFLSKSFPGHAMDFLFLSIHLMSTPRLTLLVVLAWLCWWLGMYLDHPSFYITPRYQDFDQKRKDGVTAKYTQLGIHPH